MQNNVFPKCTLCQQPPKNGLYDGFRLSGKFICSACQNEIVSTPTDSESYDAYLSALKKIIFAGDRYPMSKISQIKYIP